MNRKHATGHVRVMKRRDGEVLYAKFKLPDGREPQRRLGKLWRKRTPPPPGSDHLTRRMAEARLAAMLAGEDPSLSVEPQRAVITFGQACDEWLTYIQDDRQRRPSTVRDYRYSVRFHLLPAFGADTPIEDITTPMVDAYRARLVAEGKAARTVNKLLIMLHGIFRRAGRQHGLARNPVAAAERQPERRSGDFGVLDPDEVRLLASVADNEQDAALFTVAAFTGLRLGELLALRWRDVSFAMRLVHVRRSWVRGHEDTPKSHKVRSVPLIDQAAVALDGLSQRELFTGDEDRVFVNDVGDVLGQDLLRRRFRAALGRAGLNAMRLHDLRHTFGTLAVQAFPLSDVKVMMGHADIATTMIYVHHVPAHDAADRLSALVAADGRGLPARAPVGGAGA